MSKASAYIEAHRKYIELERPGMGLSDHGRVNLENNGSIAIHGPGGGLVVLTQDDAEKLSLWIIDVYRGE